MTRWVLAAGAADDLDRLVALLLEQTPEDAMQMVDPITDALNILQRHPRIGRPHEAGLRELVISRGKTGYLASYEYDEVADLVIVLAVRHQREEDYHQAPSSSVARAERFTGLTHHSLHDMPHTSRPA